MRKIWFVLAGILVVVVVVFLRSTDKIPPTLLKLAGIIVIAIGMFSVLIYIYAHGNKTGVWNK